jgi:iron-sulfur cluster repair protein YtfE (RIC family)
MLKDRKAYETTLDAQLAQWSADLNVLKAKATRAEVNAKVQYDKVIDAMQHKHDEAGKNLRALKNATDEAWESMKTSTEKVWVEVKALFEKSSK